MLVMQFLLCFVRAEGPGPGWCSPTDFGAKGNGIHIDTDAINRALAARNCSTVALPAGRAFVSGTIQLQNDTDLYLAAGSAILAAPSAGGIGGRAGGNYMLATPNPFDMYQDYGHSHWRDALLWGEGLRNVRIFGEGVIDGRTHLRTSCSNSSVSQGCKMLGVRSSSGLAVEGLTLRNGGWFTMLLTDVERVRIANVTVLAARDGIDLVGCRDVEVVDSSVSGGGDDALALKSDYSLGRVLASRNVTVRRCALSSGRSQGVGCQGIQFGSETVGNFSDMLFEDVSIASAGKAGIGITSMDGAHISNITFARINISHATTPFHLYIGARAWRHRPPPPPGAPLPVGSIAGVTFRAIRADHISGRPPSFWRDTNFTWTIDGQPAGGNVTVEHAVRDVRFEDVTVTYKGGGAQSDTALDPAHDPNDGGPRIMGVRPAYGLWLRHAAGVQLTRVALGIEAGADDKRPAVILEQARQVSFQACSFQRGRGVSFDVGLRNMSNGEVDTVGSPGLVTRQIP